jgi:chemotaxis protein histidine kinase CheA
MFCSNCGAKNEGDKKFCSNCGAKNGDTSVASTGVSNQSTSTVRKIKLKHLFSIVIVIALSVLVYFASVYYADYVTVTEQLEKARTQTENAEYQKSADMLTVLDESGVWIAPWIADDFELLRTNAENNASSQGIFTEAVSLRDSGSIEQAREKFDEIPLDYAGYNEVQAILAELQLEIENQLREDLELNEAKAEDAIARADAETARAQANAAAARKAEQDRAAANASASAAAREKEEAQAFAVEQQEDAFIDETVTIYNSLSSGSDELVTALDYGYENSDDLLYHINRAQTIFLDVEQRAVNFYEYRTPEGWEDIPTWLYSASTNYQEGLILILEGGSAYYDTETSSREFSAIVDEATEYIETGYYYESLISEFLTEVGR